MLSRADTRALQEKLTELSRSLSSEHQAELDRVLFLGLSGHEQLTLLDSAELLSPDEQRSLARAKARIDPDPGLKRHSLVVILKATRRCNLRCSYCRAWRPDDSPDISFDVLAEIMAQTLSIPGLVHVEFIWHGGEVTLLGRETFLKAMLLQAQYKQPQTKIHNSVQTNGVRIASSLLQLFRHFEFSVGVSIDAPRPLHDSMRLNRAGKPTWHKVQAGIAAMKQYGLPLALLCVVGPRTVEMGAAALLESLAEMGVRDVGLLNMVPENGCERAAQPEEFISWTAYLGFLAEVYTLWQRKYADRLVLRELNDLHVAVQGGRPSLCYFAENCAGHYLTFEANGDVAACDKYVGLPAFDFGSILDRSLPNILRQSARLDAARAEIDDSMAEMSACRWYGVCQGGCPHDRRLNQVLGQATHGCCGYSGLLDHIAAHQAARTAPPLSERTTT